MPLLMICVAKCTCVYRQQHLNAVRGLRFRAEEGRANGRMAECYRELGRPGESLEYSERYMFVAKELADKGGQAIASSVCLLVFSCSCMG